MQHHPTVGTVGMDVTEILWGCGMASAGHGLRIKYGLGTDPSANKQAEWARLTREYIAVGRDRDQAGDLAARRIFSDYQTHAYASQADTLEALLRAAEEK